MGVLVVLNTASYLFSDFIFDLDELWYLYMFKYIGLLCAFMTLACQAYRQRNISVVLSVLGEK